MSKLSTYDETLSENAKQGIKSAKNDWAKAKANNDTVGMAKANAVANNIRKAYGGYSGGDDGSSFYPVKQQTNIQKPEFASKYDDKIRNVQKRILSRDEFTYDVDTDPVYQLYKKVYTEMGNNAYDRALSGRALKTGGIVNTDAATSAVLAQNVYNSLLADKATELSESAYQKYKDSITDDYNMLSMLQNADSSDYKRYRDSMDDYYNQRDFEYKKYNDEQDEYKDNINSAVDFAYKIKKDETENQRWLDEFNYNKYLDQIENEKWQTEFDEKKLNNQRNYDLKAAANANNLAFDYAKLDSDNEKWKAQIQNQKYNTLAKLIKSVYDTDEIVDIEELKDMLGL